MINIVLDQNRSSERVVIASPDTHESIENLSRSVGDHWCFFGMDLADYLTDRSTWSQGWASLFRTKILVRTVVSQPQCDLTVFYDLDHFSWKTPWPNRRYRVWPMTLSSGGRREDVAGVLEEKQPCFLWDCTPWGFKSSYRINIKTSPMDLGENGFDSSCLVSWLIECNTLWPIEPFDHQTAILHGRRMIYLISNHWGSNKIHCPEDENLC